jgi:hypothetical protein
VLYGEGHGTREELGKAARKNPPVYGEQHVVTVVSGTRETLPRTISVVKREPISPEGEVASGEKGVGEGGST